MNNSADTKMAAVRAVNRQKNLKISKDLENVLIPVKSRNTSKNNSLNNSPKNNFTWEQ